MCRLFARFLTSELTCFVQIEKNLVQQKNGFKPVLRTKWMSIINIKVLEQYRSLLENQCILGTSKRWKHWGWKTEMPLCVEMKIQSHMFRRNEKPKGAGKPLKEVQIRAARCLTRQHLEADFSHIFHMKVAIPDQYRYRVHPIWVG